MLPKFEQLRASGNWRDRTDDNGMSECQSYRYEPDPAGAEHVFYRNQRGGYQGHGTRLALGTRSAYHDYSF